MHAGAIGLLQVSSTLFLRPVLSLSLGLLFSATQAVHQIPGHAPGSASLALGLKAHMSMLNLHLNIGDLNSGPYAPTARLLHKAPNPQQSATLVTK